jgi:hypothetical protein
MPPRLELDAISRRWKNDQEEVWRCQLEAHIRPSGRCERRVCAQLRRRAPVPESLFSRLGRPARNRCRELGIPRQLRMIPDRRNTVEGPVVRGYLDRPSTRVPYGAAASRRCCPSSTVPPPIRHSSLRIAPSRHVTPGDIATRQGSGEARCAGLSSRARLDPSDHLRPAVKHCSRGRLVEARTRSVKAELGKSAG